MKTYYFTFGTDLSFPYQRGWVEVRAESDEEANEKFRTRFPDRPGHEGIINCAFVYSEEKFKNTTMASGRYPEEYCHEIIE